MLKSCLILSLLAAPSLVHANGESQIHLTTQPDKTVFTQRVPTDYGATSMFALSLAPGKTLEQITQGFVFEHLACTENSALAARLRSEELSLQSVKSKELSKKQKADLSQTFYGFNKEGKQVCKGKAKPYVMGMNHASCATEEGWLELWGVVSACANKEALWFSTKPLTQRHTVEDDVSLELRKALFEQVMAHPLTADYQAAYVKTLASATKTDAGFVMSFSEESGDTVEQLFKSHWTENEVSVRHWKAASNQEYSVSYVALELGASVICAPPRTTFFFKVNAESEAELLHVSESAHFEGEGVIADFNQDGTLEFANSDREGSTIWQMGEKALTLLSPYARHQQRGFCEMGIF